MSAAGSRARRSASFLRPGSGLLILPPAVWVLAVLVAPIVLIGLYSVNLKTNLLGVPTAFSTANWKDFLPPGSNPFWDRFKISMTITLVVSVITVVAAYPLAYFLAFVAGKRRYALLMVLLAPFFTSYLLRVIAWEVILNNHGVINSLLWDLGLRTRGDGIPWLIYSKFSVGLVLFYSWVPFVAVPMFVVLDTMDRSLIEAAHDLGASRLTAFLRVTFPLSIPGVIAGFVFVLIPTTGEFITPLLGGRSQQLHVRQLDPVILHRHAQLELRRGAGAVAGGDRAGAAAAVRALPQHRPRGRGHVSSAVGRLGRIGLSSYFTLLVLFLYAPLVVLVVFAFEDSYIQALPWAGFTTKWFHTAFANTDLTSALRRSAMIGLLDGLAATALGTMAAVALARRHLFLRPLWTTLLLLPLVVPYIVLAIGMVIVLHQLGYQASLSAVLVGHIAISLPYSLLVVLPRLRTLDAVDRRGGP